MTQFTLSAFISGLTDMIDGDRLTESHIPDDFEWLQTSMHKLSAPALPALSIFNNCPGGTEPEWSLYDGLEIYPCRDVSDSGDESEIEQCEPPQAQFWTVYGHLKAGGLEALHDSPTEQDAESIAGIYRRLSGLGGSPLADLMAALASFESSPCDATEDQMLGAFNALRRAETKAGKVLRAAVKDAGDHYEYESGDYWEPIRRRPMGDFATNAQNADAFVIYGAGGDHKAEFETLAELQAAAPMLESV